MKMLAYITGYSERKQSVTIIEEGDLKALWSLAAECARCNELALRLHGESDVYKLHIENI